MSARPLLDLYESDDEQFDDRLNCHIKRISYDVKRRKGYIEIPDGECVSMDAAIALFKAIDPKAAVIHAGDTTYMQFDGGWCITTRANRVTLIHHVCAHPREIHPKWSNARGEQSC